jgi:hypothetical protein
LGGNLGAGLGRHSSDCYKTILALDLTPISEVVISPLLPSCLRKSPHRSDGLIETWCVFGGDLGYINSEAVSRMGASWAGAYSFSLWMFTVGLLCATVCKWHGEPQEGSLWESLGSTEVS